MIDYNRIFHIEIRFYFSLILTFSLLCFSSCSFSEKKDPFSFKESKNGVDLYEDMRPVFFYQREPKVLSGQYVCNNYLHPLYSLSGDTLTEESPADHPYHRGIYWAWHQIYINDQSIADGWVMENLSHEIIKLKTGLTKSTAQLTADVLWKSAAWQNGAPFANERVIILVHRKHKDFRIIDFEIRLRALTTGISIGGSDDEKGYGGFCTRIKLPDDIKFTSENGPVIPQNLQIEAGPWMDFSGSFGRDGTKSGLTIICDPQTPNYPAPWILRKEGSMQNVVYPGRQRVSLPMDNDLVLKYRMVIHETEMKNIKIDQLIEKNKF